MASALFLTLGELVGSFVSFLCFNFFFSFLISLFLISSFSFSDDDRSTPVLSINCLYDSLALSYTVS